MRLLSSSLLVVALSASAHAQLSSDMQAKIAAATNKSLAETGVPSASVSVVMGGKVVYSQAFGDANISPKVAATVAMAYPIGSVSKQFTSTGVLLLQQEGKLSIDDKVGKYFPELTRANDVSLRNLMTMTSGYEDFAPQDYSIPVWYTPRKPIDTVREWATKPLDFEPGTEYQYSNTNYVLLSLIVEKVTGEPFYKFLRERVLNAAKLPDVFNAYTDREKLQVTGYQSFAMQAPRVMPLEAASWYFGDGELAMPASTLAKWDITFMEQSVLKPESYKVMETPFTFVNGKVSGYGLGLGIHDRNGHRQLVHGGEVGGYVSENIVYPDDKIAIVVLTNEVASGAASQIGEAVTEIVLPGAVSPAPAAAADPLGAKLPAIMAAFAKGEIDRTLFTANCNFYFSKDALADFKATVAPLGAVMDVKRTGTGLRGGMTFGGYRVSFANGTALVLSTYLLPDGKIEQFLIVGKS